MEKVLLFTPDHIAVKRRVEFECSAGLELLWVQYNVDIFVLFAMHLLKILNITSCTVPVLLLCMKICLPPLHN